MNTDNSSTKTKRNCDSSFNIHDTIKKQESGARVRWEFPKPFSRPENQAWLQFKFYYLCHIQFLKEIFKKLAVWIPWRFISVEGT